MQVSTGYRGKRRLLSLIGRTKPPPRLFSFPPSFLLRFLIPTLPLPVVFPVHITGLITSYSCTWRCSSPFNAFKVSHRHFPPFSFLICFDFGWRALLSKTSWNRSLVFRGYGHFFSPREPWPFPCTLPFFLCRLCPTPSTTFLRWRADLREFCSRFCRSQTFPFRSSKGSSLTHVSSSHRPEILPPSPPCPLRTIPDCPPLPPQHPLCLRHGRCLSDFKFVSSDSLSPQVMIFTFPKDTT